jgi:hypothetical protein
MSKQARTKLYELLYSWDVTEDCDNCEHITSYRDNDNRHPCAQCKYGDRFKIANRIKADLKDKVNEILKVVNQKEE